MGAQSEIGLNSTPKWLKATPIWLSSHHWVNFQRRGVLLIWITVGQGPTALTVGAGGGCLDIFSLVYHFSFSFPLSLGDGPISTEILSQRAVKPKTINQSINPVIIHDDFL